MSPHDMSDRELQAHALRMWANRVETGNPDLSADDMLAQRKQVSITRDGMKLALRLRELADSISP